MPACVAATTSSSPFSPELQTNGVLLNKDWAEFLKENRFLVGLSGPRELHDRYRVNKGGAPTFDKVMAAVNLLRRNGVPFNTLTCVHRFNADRPLDVYRFLRRELDSAYIQFIPIGQIRGFETTAPHTWDRTRPPIVGSPRSKPDRPDSIVTEWSVDPTATDISCCAYSMSGNDGTSEKVLVNHIETLVAQHLDCRPRYASIMNSAARASLSSMMEASIRATTTFIRSIAWATCTTLRSPGWCSLNSRSHSATRNQRNCPAIVAHANFSVIVGANVQKIVCWALPTESPGSIIFAVAPRNCSSTRYPISNGSPQPFASRMTGVPESQDRAANFARVSAWRTRNRWLPGLPATLSAMTLIST